MIKEKVGIFIKTCKKDHDWLKFCLLSLKKNASGFDGICIVTDSDHDMSDLKDQLDVPLEVHSEKVPKISHTCQDGTGYLWMQRIKLEWHKYCDYDVVLQIDSDCIVHSPITPLFYLKDEKWKWWVRSWDISELAIVHKKPLAKLLGRDSLYEHMPYPGWIMHRSNTIKFHQWLHQKHDCDWWHYLVHKTNEDWGNEINEPNIKGTSRGSSIYNAYGGFLESNKENYVFIEGFVDSPPIKQYWSHGGLNSDIQKEIEQILAESK